MKAPWLLADPKLLMPTMLWMSAASAIMLAGLLFAGLDGRARAIAVLALAYGAGAVAAARQWPRTAEPSGARWAASSFFAALPIAYALSLTFAD